MRILPGNQTHRFDEAKERSYGIGQALHIPVAFAGASSEAGWPPGSAILSGMAGSGGCLFVNSKLFGDY